MITDKETNFVYFSELLRTDVRFSETCNKLTGILDKYNVKYGFLKSTKDIWCRDYMPIQIAENKYVQFRYDPSYLNDTEEYKKLKSDTREVCKANSIKPIFSDINLDGGNVIKWKDKVVLTDRIFDENENYGDDKLIKDLEGLFGAEIIIIPQIFSDVTGHADGLIRFFNGNTILVNELKNEVKYWQKGILEIINQYNFDFIEIPWFEDIRKDFRKKYKESAIGLYINFLEVCNLLLIPKFEIDGNRDQEAFEIFQKHYSDRTIVQVEVNEIAKFGGVLNCITWNIKI